MEKKLIFCTHNAMILTQTFVMCVWELCLSMMEVVVHWKLHLYYIQYIEFDSGTHSLLLTLYRYTTATWVTTTPRSSL